jgi:pentatricopeptide repeat protein
MSKQNMLLACYSKKRYFDRMLKLFKETKKNVNLKKQVK